MPSLSERMLALFPVLSELSPEALSSVINGGVMACYAPGTLLAKNDKLCPFVPLVVSGSLRIFISSEEGREITLYHANPGDCCLMGIACRMKAGVFPAEVEVEQESELFTIPSALYERYLEPNVMWNRFLFASLYEGMYVSMTTFESLLFSRVDERLAQFLLEQSHGRPTTIYTTHEQIAVKLNTAREVVSRLLGELKRRGILTYERGKVRILNIEALKALIPETSG